MMQPSAHPINSCDASRSDGLNILWQDLLPSAGRLRDTLRMTLAVIVAAVLCYAGRLPMMWLALYFCIALAKKSVTETVLTGAVVMFAILIAIPIGLLSLRVSADVPPLRLTLLALYVFGAFYLGRVMKEGDLAHDMGIAIAFIMIMPDVLPTPELWPIMALKFVHLAFIGVVSVVGMTCLIPPRDPLADVLNILRRQLLLTAERFMALRLSQGLPKPSPERETQPILHAIARLNECKMAHPAMPRTMNRLAELIALIDRLRVDADNLVSANESWATPDNPDDGLHRLELACHYYADFLGKRADAVMKGSYDENLLLQTVETAPDVTTPEGSFEKHGAFDACRQTLGDMGTVLSDEKTPAESLPTESAVEPDAFSNKTYVQHAIKGTLALMTCYFLMRAWNVSSIHTCVVTCLIIALSTSGAIMHKMILRIGGAMVGAFLALTATAFIIPYLSSITSFCLLLGTFTFIGAWVSAGEERISYAGWQICLAVFMMMAHDFGPSTDLTVLRDRLMGILLGNMMMVLFFTLLWPERAAGRMWEKLMDTFRQLAAMARIPVAHSRKSEVLNRLYRVKMQFNRDVINGLSLMSHALYERGAFSESGKQSRSLYRQSMKAAFMCAQTLQAIDEHRDDYTMRKMPQPVLAAGVNCQLTAAAVLEQFAEHLRNPAVSVAHAMKECSSAFSFFMQLARKASLPITEEQRDYRISLYARLLDQLTHLTELSAQQKGSPWGLA